MTPPAGSGEGEGRQVAKPGALGESGWGLMGGASELGPEFWLADARRAGLFYLRRMSLVKLPRRAVEWAVSPE